MELRFAREMANDRQTLAEARTITPEDIPTPSSATTTVRSTLTTVCTAQVDVLVDLCGLVIVDSIGFRVLAALARAQADGFDLTLVRPPAAVYRIIEITGLDQVLRFVDDPADAEAGDHTGS
jgi:anti-anti-sigma factor